MDAAEIVPWDLPTIRFPGQYYDAETGLHYNRHRYYDPSIGRYISADPIGQAGGVNLYSYVFNNPVNWFDPLGLDCSKWTYSQSTGTLSCTDDDTGEKFEDDQCYSGKGPDKNNPDSQDKKDQGPIPRGPWEIGDSDDSKGPITIDLNPQPGNTVFETDREPDTFRAHGDSSTAPGEASEGCIVCKRSTREKMKNDGGVINVTR